MIKEQDIKDLYQIEGFLAGLSCLLDDWKLNLTSASIEETRVGLANVINRLEKEYESDRGYK